VEKTPVRAALGRARERRRLADQCPAHDNSAMDGYASAPRRPRRRRAGDAHRDRHSYAGREFNERGWEWECVRVMTGAVMPKNTDTVVIQEAVNVDGKLVTIPPGQERGQNRARGRRPAERQPALRAGRMLRPAISLIASLGIAR